MLILSQTRFQLSRHYPIVTGESVTEEGRCLVFAADGGESGVKHSAGAGTEIFAGVSMSHVILPNRLPFHGVLSAVGTTLTLPFTPISGQIRLLDGAQVLAAGNPGTTANEYSIAGNIVTLHSGQANKAITISLVYTPTVDQALAFQGEGFPGAQASVVPYGVCGAITRGTVATTCYNVDTAWTAGAKVRAGANGLFTQGGSGTLFDNVICSRAPSAASPYLVLDIL